MREKLYWTIEKFSLRFAYFAFFDTAPYLADQLFIRRKVRVWFDKEFAKELSKVDQERNQPAYPKRQRGAAERQLLPTAL